MLCPRPVPDVDKNHIQILARTAAVFVTYYPTNERNCAQLWDKCCTVIGSGGATNWKFCPLKVGQVFVKFQEIQGRTGHLSREAVNVQYNVHIYVQIYVHLLTKLHLFVDGSVCNQSILPCHVPIWPDIPTTIEEAL